MSDLVSTLRARPDTIRLGEPGAAVIAVRVEMPEVWDAVRIEAPVSEPVVALKVRALAVLYPDADFHEAFVVKLHGCEVLDENASLGDIGAVAGSTLLVMFRRRRPVRI